MVDISASPSPPRRESIAHSRGGIDGESDEMRFPAGKLRELSSGLWYVHCKWCTAEARLEALDLLPLPADGPGPTILIRTKRTRIRSLRASRASVSFLDFQPEQANEAGLLNSRLLVSRGAEV